MALARHQLNQIHPSTATVTGQGIIWDNTAGKWIVSAADIRSFGANFRVQYAENLAFGSHSSFNFDPTNIRLGLGINLPVAALHIQSEGTTSATDGLKIQDSGSVELFNVGSDGKVYLAKSLTLSTNATYSALKTGNAASITITNAAGVSNTNAVNAFKSTFILAGADAFTLARGIELQLQNTNTNTANDITGLYVSANLNSAGARASSIVGGQFLATTNTATGGTVATVTGLKVKARLQTSGATVTSMTGIYIEDLTNVAGGTITDITGLYIGDVTPSGTVTNTPYSLYSQDTNSYSYIAGKTGFGVLAPTSKLHIAAGAAAANTGSLKIDSATTSVLTTPEKGAVEFNDKGLYFTPNSARYFVGQ